MGFGCTRDGVMSCVRGRAEGLGGTEDRFELGEKMCWVFELGFGESHVNFFTILWPATRVRQTKKMKNFGEKFEGLKKE
jgi:hypothetical protein